MTDEEREALKAKFEARENSGSFQETDVSDDMPNPRITSDESSYRRVIKEVSRDDETNMVLALVFSLVGGIVCFILALCFISKETKRGFADDIKVKAAKILCIIKIVFLIIWVIMFASIEGLMIGTLKNISQPKINTQQVLPDEDSDYEQYFNSNNIM